MEIFRIITPTPLSIFSFFYSLHVTLKWNLIQQNWSAIIQALKSNQGTKFGTNLEAHDVQIINDFDVMIFFYLIWLIKQNIEGMTSNELY